MEINTLVFDKNTQYLVIMKTRHSEKESMQDRMLKQSLKNGEN